MGFLRRLLGRQAPPPEAVPEERPATLDLGDRRGELPAGGFALASGPGMEVVGESHYREAITQVVGVRPAQAIKLVTQAALMAEPTNPYDTNAVGVWIEGRKVGHLARADAAAFAPVLARLTARQLTGYGRADIYGGWALAGGGQADCGITLYIGGSAKQAAWLDRALDGKTAAQVAQATPAMRPGRGRGPGMVRGRHHSEWHPEVKRLEDAGDEPAAVGLLLEICDATEAESRAEGYGVAPVAYERLAVLYRKRKDRAAELDVLERYEAAPHAPGAVPGQLAERLARLRG